MAMRYFLTTLAILAACGGDKTRATDSAATAAATEASNATPLRPNEMMLDVPGGRIWYKVSGPGAGIPAILLHGGPGFSSYYLKSLEALSNDRPVIRYDQLGAGRSDRISDTSMFTIDHYVRELDSLRARLKYDKVDLIGHSWGTILAVEYYRAHPEHVASLTLASPALDLAAWEKNARDLVKTLSDSSQRAIKTREAEKKFDAPD